MDLSNAKVAKILRTVAAALTLKKTSIFQIRAYEIAADAIEHLTADIKDLWEENKLKKIPGVGVSLQSYLDELFKTGHAKHFDSILKDLPPVFADFLDIPGIGPKTAEKLVQAGIKSLDALKKLAEGGELQEKGFSQSLTQNILKGLDSLGSKTSRMFLPVAQVYADRILAYLRGCPQIEKVDSLGSLRRRVATIGDLDFAASSNNPFQAIEFFTKMPGVKQVVEKGENKAVVILSNNLHVDLLVGAPNSYGALLHHFTGSKHHNIKLRTLAEEKNFSISEHGVKDLRSGKLIPINQEHELYDLLGMQTPTPEMREDSGEIEAALAHKLPKIIEYGSLRGDLHLHSSYPIEPSHDLGVNSMEEIIERAIELGYEYIGLSDHSPSVSNHTREQIIDILKKRKDFIDDLKQIYKDKIHVLAGLEADIQGDGSISVPDEGLKLLDYCIAGVHSLHQMPEEKMSLRLEKALTNPYVTILAHPTGRLLNKRESSQIDWERILQLAKQHKKILEINSFPDRLDLRDDLVRQAIGVGVKLVINSDAHRIDQMDNLKFGISVARRGWATPSDVVNTYPWREFVKILKKE